MKIKAPELVGVDAQIGMIQDYLESYFTSVFSGSFEIYGRLFSTDKENGKYLEAWVNDNDYNEVFINDNCSLTVGFVVKSKTIENRILTSKVDVIFTGNGKELLNSSDRKDERIFLELFKGLRKSMLIKSISNPREGIDNVFSGFKTDAIKYRDMQPWFCMSFEIEIEYSDNLS